jgi:chemotaxis protein histidine kinase CheA
LHIAERMVTAIGGRIQVESEPGYGSTFRVALPTSAIVKPDVGKS